MTSHICHRSKLNPGNLFVCAEKGSTSGRGWKLLPTATPCSQMKIHGGEERNVYPKRLDRKREWVGRKLCVLDGAREKHGEMGSCFTSLQIFSSPIFGSVYVASSTARPGGGKEMKLKHCKNQWKEHRSRLVELNEKFRETDWAFSVWIIILPM